MNTRGQSRDHMEGSAPGTRTVLPSSIKSCTERMVDGSSEAQCEGHKPRAHAPANTPAGTTTDNTMYNLRHGAWERIGIGLVSIPRASAEACYQNQCTALARTQALSCIVNPTQYCISWLNVASDDHAIKLGCETPLINGPDACTCDRRQTPGCGSQCGAADMRGGE